MIIKICLYVMFWIILWSLGSLFLAFHENLDTIKRKNLFRLPKCKKCNKKLNRKQFLPIIGFLFQKNNCTLCKRRISIIKPVLEILTALMFWLIGYYASDLNIVVVVFWMLTARILLLISLCDIIRYEINVSLVILWELLVLLSFAFWLFDVKALRWAVVFLVVFIILYYGSLYYTKLKYNTEEEWVGMWDLIISPYLGVLLYIWIKSHLIYTEELFCSVLLFFIFTSIFWLLFYVILNVILGKKADFLSNEMADRSLPLVPSMVLSLLVVILWHHVFFNFLVNFWDSFFETL